VTRATGTATGRWIGEPIPRKEDRRLVTGRGRFVADLRLPGMLSAVVFRSPHAHARLHAVDLEAARRAPGVVAAWVACDVGEVGRIPMRMSPRPQLAQCLQPPIAVGKVRYVGEPVAVVVATDRYRAEDALELVTAEFEPLRPVTDAREALAPGAAVLHEGFGQNLAERIVMHRGDAARALVEAPVRVAHRFRVQRHTAVPLETRGLLASHDRGTDLLTVWGPTKVPHHNRGILARLLGRAEHRVHFIETEVGGGFGVRGEFYPEDFLIPWAAIRLGAPVQWIEDRREHFVAANHSREQWHDMEIGAARDGRILALTDRIHADMGAYIRTHGVVVPDRTAAMLPGPYRVEHYRADVACVFTSKTPAGTYRGPGRYEGTVVREQVVDALARTLGLDPADVRRRNFVSPDDMPYDVGATVDSEPVVYDAADFRSAFEVALVMVDYAALRRWQAEARQQGRLVGVGIGCLVEKSGTGPWEFARVELDRDGAAVVYTGLAMLGQGLETTLAQLCADALGVHPDAVTVVHGDTARVPHGVGTFGSRGAVVGGNAVFEAGRRLRAKVVALAAERLEADPRDLVVDDGCVVPRGAPDRGLTFAELARVAASPRPAEPDELGLSATAFFAAPKRPYPYGTHVAAVEIDAETGRLAVLRYAIAYDVGRIINPTIVEGQLVGGLAQGLGGALLEELAYDAGGQLTTTTFMDYLLPTAMEMPATLDVRVLEEAPSPLNPLGVKGAGEGGCTGAGAALANAVADALAPLGVTVSRLPLSPDSVLAAIRAARGGGRG
jgi:aerobic carbon-monoxide dehydrogenase large subunit